MTATVLTSFRTHNARQFVESLSESANDVYYMFIGKPTPWANSDLTIATPEDSVANSAFGYWDDIVAMRRITTTDLIYVVPRHDWTANTKYSMYDHRIPLTNAIANTSHPFYVKTSANAVFKCLFNGTVNAIAGGSNSTSEPTVVGQTDVASLTYASGVPYDYVWKYLYTINVEEANKYLTDTYMPIRATHDTQTANGEISDDSTDQYDVFNTARVTSNGAIYRVVVENGGSGYTTVPSVLITGDGTGAEGVAVISSGKVTHVNLSAVGSNYSWANVAITSNDDGSGATAAAIISPCTWYANSTTITYKTNHAINLVEELGARHVMLYAQLPGSGSNNELGVGNQYRRIGIVKNPLLYGTSNVATGNSYSQTLDLELSGQIGSFSADEIVRQASTNAYGVVFSTAGSILKLVNVHGTFTANGTILGIGNGNVNGQIVNSITIPTTPLYSGIVVPPSGATATISSITNPAMTPYSGTIMYVDHRAPITRASDQAEIIRTILSF